MKCSSVIFQPKDLRESKEQDILNRSKLLSPTDSKATFVQGAISHRRALPRQV